jgi:hypothetical protein
MYSGFQHAGQNLEKLHHSLKYPHKQTNKQLDDTGFIKESCIKRHVRHEAASSRKKND